jgi:hypothetical protein
MMHHGALNAFANETSLHHSTCLSRRDNDTDDTDDDNDNVARCSSFDVMPIVAAVAIIL